MDGLVPRWKICAAMKKVVKYRGENAMNIVWPWKMVGRYTDGEEITVCGYSEDDCMNKLISLMEKHGDLTWYSGVSDEDYADGEYIGAENFIYD